MKTVLAALAACLAAAAVAAADDSLKGKSLPDFSMTAVTTRGTRPVAKKDLLGKVWVADFVFTRCQGPCPFVSARMQRMQKRLPKEVLLVSFTVDPEYDKPPVLAKYAEKYDADPERWMFVTAPDEATMIPLLRDGFGTAVKPDQGRACGFTTTHSSKFALVGPDGRLLHMYVSKEPAELDRLERDARALLKGGS